MTFKNRVEKATVSLTKLNGRGVLVRGNFILTAAHCLEYYGPGLTLGDHHREPIRSADGKELMVGPLAIEPVHDIAVLGALDDQEFSRECANFEKFCKKTEPIEICKRSFMAFKKYPAFVYAHEGK
jgi:trypsin